MDEINTKVREINSSRVFLIFVGIVNLSIVFFGNIDVHSFYYKRYTQPIHFIWSLVPSLMTLPTSIISKNKWVNWSVGGWGLLFTCINLFFSDFAPMMGSIS